MKHLEKVVFDKNLVKKELEEFRDLLDNNKELEERKQILPFFRARKHLSAFTSAYLSGINAENTYALEFDVFGSFKCDLVSYDKSMKTYNLIEFEDASQNSVFTKLKTKATSEYSPRLDHGYSQIIDWLCKIDDLRRTGYFKSLFGTDYCKFNGLLIIGRNSFLDTSEIERLQWRNDNVTVNKIHLNCITYDELLECLQIRLAAFF